MDEDIRHFVAVTGSSVDEARTMLEACAGNLDMAVNMHLEYGGSRHEGAAKRRKTGEGSSRDTSSSGNPRTYEEMWVLSPKRSRGLITRGTNSY